jgi:SM-20-related protein
MAQSLTDHGWSEQDVYLPDELCLLLADECVAREAAGALHGGATGKAPRLAASAYRGDQIGWLAAGDSVACDRYLAVMEQLRIGLNRSLFLGLEHYESHFAIYQPGAIYRRHLDRFRDDDRRTVSVVIYLNAVWPIAQGGSLRIYPEGMAEHDIAPIGGRLVLFMSGQIAHEVMPATHCRLSLAGWFSRRS